MCSDKNMKLSFSSNSASSKASSSESTASSVNCVTVSDTDVRQSVYLPERRLNFQLNRPGPAVLTAYVIHFSLKIRKIS